MVNCLSAPSPLNKYKVVYFKNFCSFIVIFFNLLHLGLPDNATDASYDTSSSEDIYEREQKYALKPEEKYKKYEIFYSFDAAWDIITGPEFANVPFVKKIINLWNTTRRPKIVQKKPRKKRLNVTTTLAPKSSDEVDLNTTEILSTTSTPPTIPSTLAPGQRHPFVLIEGTLTSTRRRLLRGLMKHTSFIYVRNFRQHPFKYKDKFSSFSLLKLKRAYVTLQFYLTGRDVERILQERPVIMTGFWMRQAAEFVARRYKSVAALPPKGDQCYQWPSDLVRPDLVFFLHTPRSGAHIKEDTIARLDRIIEIYHRMDPAVVDVDQVFNNATEKQYAELRKQMIDKLLPRFPWAQQYVKYKPPADKLRRKGFLKNKMKGREGSTQENITAIDETTASTG